MNNKQEQKVIDILRMSLEQPIAISTMLALINQELKPLNKVSNCRRLSKIIIKLRTEGHPIVQVKKNSVSMYAYVSSKNNKS